MTKPSHGVPERYGPSCIPLSFALFRFVLKGNKAPHLVIQDHCPDSVSNSGQSLSMYQCIFIFEAQNRSTLCWHSLGALTNCTLCVSCAKNNSLGCRNYWLTFAKPQQTQSTSPQSVKRPASKQ